MWGVRLRSEGGRHVLQSFSSEPSGQSTAASQRRGPGTQLPSEHRKSSASQSVGIGTVQRTGPGVSTHTITVSRAPIHTITVSTPHNHRQHPTQSPSAPAHTIIASTRPHPRTVPLHQNPPIKSRTLSDVRTELIRPNTEHFRRQHPQAQSTEAYKARRHYLYLATHLYSRPDAMGERAGAPYAYPWDTGWGLHRSRPDSR